jgi:hypothetical protein
MAAATDQPMLYRDSSMAAIPTKGVVDLDLPLAAIGLYTWLWVHPDVPLDAEHIAAHLFRDDPDSISSLLDLLIAKDMFQIGGAQ